MRYTRAMERTWTWGLAWALAAVACGSSGGGGQASDAAAPGDGAVADASEGGEVDSGATDGASRVDASDSSVADGPAATDTGTDVACTPTLASAQAIPVDLFVMLGQAGSMSDMVSGGGTKWQAVTGGLQSFVAAPGLAGVSAGLGYFPLSVGTMCPVTCGNNNDCGTGCSPCSNGACVGGSPGDSCSAADYAVPDVEIAALPGASASFITSLASHSPNGSTPTSAALQGAINHAASWGAAHAGHDVVDVLVTDGVPNECDTVLADVSAIAAAGLAGSPSVATYVVAIGTPSSGLDPVAAAGGTGQALPVVTTSNVQQQFAAALATVRASQCAYQIPGGVAPAHVGMQLTPNGGAAATVPPVQDAAHCPAAGDGWYFDSPTTPSRVFLCPATCTTLAGGGALQVIKGC